MIALLGPEPLGNAFDGAMLAEACAGKKTSLKAALSDQRVVAGLGNIYVCEALHRAHLSPKRIASTIATERARRTSARMRSADAIRAVLNDAISAGGSSLRDHRRTDGELGDFQHNFRVYDRAGEKCPTPRCKGTIKRIVQGTRSHVLLSGVSEVMPLSPREVEAKAGDGRFLERPLRRTPSAFATLSPQARTRRGSELTPSHTPPAASPRNPPAHRSAPAGIPPAG